MLKRQKKYMNEIKLSLRNLKKKKLHLIVFMVKEDNALNSLLDKVSFATIPFCLIRETGT